MELDRLDLTKVAARYGLGALSDGMKGEDGAVRARVLASAAMERDELKITGAAGSCTLVLAAYSLRVEASVPLYIRQHVADFPTQQPIAVVSFEDRGKYMSDVQGLSAYALPIEPGAAASAVDRSRFESCVVFQVGRSLGLLHTVPPMQWIEESPSRTGGGFSIKALIDALDLLETSKALSEAILATLQQKLAGFRSFFESSMQLHQAILHGSPTPGSVRLDGGGALLALNGWADASVGAAILDVAVAAIHWCEARGGGGVDAELLRVMVMGYHTGRQLSPHEVEMLPEAIEAAILTRVIFELAADCRDTGHLQQLRAMEDPDAAAAVVAACSGLPRSERHLFEVPAAVSYLGGCGMSPLMAQTVAVGQEAAARKARPWEPLGEEEHVGAVRECFARLINASASDVAVTPCTSYAVSVAAKNIRLTRGRRVVVLEQQMASNVLPWQEACDRSGAVLSVVRRAAGASSSWTQSVLDSLGDDVDVCAIPNCHWSDGSLIDVAKVSRACMARDIKLVLDLTQSLGVIPLDVAEVQPAFVAASVHKWLLGPYGASLMYVSPEFQGHDALPLEYHERTRHGGDDEEWDFVGAMTDAGYPSRSRADAAGLGGGGRPNPILMPMLRSSLEKVVSWQSRDAAGRVRSKPAEWARPATQRIAACARSLSLEVPADRAPHMIGIRIREDDARVDDRHAAIKAIIAHLKSSGIHCELRVGAIRVGFGVWNTFEDVNRLCSALEEAVGRAMGGRAEGPPRAAPAVRGGGAETPAAAKRVERRNSKNGPEGTDAAKAAAPRPRSPSKPVQPSRSLWYDLLNF